MREMWGKKIQETMLSNGTIIVGILSSVDASGEKIYLMWMVVVWVF